MEGRSACVHGAVVQGFKYWNVWRPKVGNPWPKTFYFKDSHFKRQNVLCSSCQSALLPLMMVVKVCNGECPDFQLMRQKEMFLTMRAFCIQPPSRGSCLDRTEQICIVWLTAKCGAVWGSGEVMEWEGSLQSTEELLSGTALFVWLWCHRGSVGVSLGNQDAPPPMSYLKIPGMIQVNSLFNYLYV